MTAPASTPTPAGIWLEDTSASACPAGRVRTATPVSKPANQTPADQQQLWEQCSVLRSSHSVASVRLPNRGTASHQQPRHRPADVLSRGELGSRGLGWAQRPFVLPAENLWLPVRVFFIFIRFPLFPKYLVTFLQASCSVRSRLQIIFWLSGSRSSRRRSGKIDLSYL